MQIERSVTKWPEDSEAISKNIFSAAPGRPYGYRPPVSRGYYSDEPMTQSRWSSTSNMQEGKIISRDFESGYATDCIPNRDACYARSEAKPRCYSNENVNLHEIEFV